MPRSIHEEKHLSERNNWLRAAVLGANDGLISTASLLVGVAAANQSSQTLLLTGLAALTAGAFSMAAGEYISVSSQADTEAADLAKEQYELDNNPERELLELTRIYESRGLDSDLAHQVAVALTEKDALGAHARDEIGVTEIAQAKPFEAAIASAIAFIIGGVVPILGLFIFPSFNLVYALMGLTIAGLVLLGIASARLGGAPVVPAVTRVVVWGTLAMIATSLIGRFFGVEV
ncbi:MULTISPECIES: VIT1/CCC1 transporter family protein [Psychrobacter]|uniref:VIT family protein n=2 Tax=Psychrobacter TaxID=497 RepID=A0A1R4GXU9_9GAMM|nr:MULTISPECIES: VIT family protein [Psychrobacter]SJM36229.1 VIT family protein [Psychrobacter pasteurii]SJM73019.1 VIT family protein [Psychrobacter piechaudii]HJH09270.1 VIT family protein [Psychrobacter pasteurii]